MTGYEEFQYAMSVGVTAPFYLTKLFAPYFAEGAAIVMPCSSQLGVWAILWIKVVTT